MTIASEITRLQWAKASAKTSIENKGVTVPANATVDTYHNYIDLISTGWAFMDSLALLGHHITGLNVNPRQYWFVSWNDSTAYYWASIIELTTSSAEYYYIICYKKVSWSDVQYPTASLSPWSSSLHSRPYKTWFYRNGNAVRVFFSEVADYSSNYAFWFQADWDWSGTPTITQIARNNNYTNLPPEADTTGYVEYSDNTRIKNITWDNAESTAHIYLTTK